MTATLTPVGDFRTEISAPLNRAMGMWSVAAKKTGEEVTKQAVAFMAQSAGRITPKSKTRRKVERHEQFGDFVAVWRKGREVPVFLGSKQENPTRYQEIKDRVLPIRLSGLARASWKWGLKKLGAGTTGATTFRDKHGVVKSGPVVENENRGHEITNRLSYITKIMPSGWESFVATKAANRMKAAAERRLTQDLNRSIRKASAFGARLTGA